MKIAIIKYNAGNIFSVDYALRRLGIEAVITDDKKLIEAADKVIFPGVGEAASTMDYLRQRQMDTLIQGLKQPVLGICIGMQLMCTHSEEGNVDCLGIFDNRVRAFVPRNHTEKVPHMGWNSIEITTPCIVPPTLDGEYLYYVHSYYAEVGNHTVATTDYITPFSAVLQRDNFYATQFHVEKSGSVGETILNAFIAL